MTPFQFRVHQAGRKTWQAFLREHGKIDLQPEFSRQLVTQDGQPLAETAQGPTADARDHDEIVIVVERQRLAVHPAITALAATVASRQNQRAQYRRPDEGLDGAANAPLVAVDAVLHLDRAEPGIPLGLMHAGTSADRP